MRPDDLMKYYLATSAYGSAVQNLTSRVQTSIRDEFGKLPLTDLVAGQRVNVMEKIQQIASEKAKSLGIKVIDVRIGRTNLPSTTAQSVYDRMRTEREREAREARAEGSEMAQKIRAKADFDTTVILADAERRAEILRGEGDAEKNGVLAKAYGKDFRFFEFYKSMQNLRKGLIGKGETTIVISPDNEFFKYLKRRKH